MPSERGLHAAGLAPGAAGLRQDLSQPDGRRGAGERGQNHWAWLASPRRGATCRNRGAPRCAGAGTQGQRRDALRDAGAVLHARPHPALHGGSSWRQESGRVVSGAVDPNPRHRGRAFDILQRAGITVTQGVLAEECARLNEAFNHWIVQRTPLVTVKAAMTLDGKIATAAGESKWITGEKARAYGMKLRQGADAVLVGINTVLADDPSLTARSLNSEVRAPRYRVQRKELRRIVLDAKGRTPLEAKVASDAYAALTTVVVNQLAPRRRVAALARQVRVLVAPGSGTRINLRWLLRKLGSEGVTSLLVEGGGEVNASFLLQGLAQRVAFFYAPMVLGGHDSRTAVAGEGARTLAESLSLTDLEWRRLGVDWLLSARVAGR